MIRENVSSHLSSPYLYQNPSAMPSTDEMFQMLHGLDMTYKAELTLYQLQSILYWTSSLEIFLFIILFLLFLSAPKDMAIVFLTSPHVARGAIGFLMLTSLPKSHEIV